MHKYGFRSEEEVAAFAAALKERWRQGDGVEPFLRDLEPELTERVRHLHWSWESVARALNAAAIRYQTGRPWTGVSLSAKIRAIRLKARRRRQAVHLASAWRQPPVSGNPDQREPAVPEPAFEFLSLKRGPAPARLPPAPVPNPPVQPVTPLSEAEMTEVLFGKPKPRG